MEPLDKTNTNSSLVPRKGERTVLSSNKAGTRSPFLGFDSSSPLVSEDMLYDYLAELLADVYLSLKEHERINKTRSNLLQGFDKGTS